MVPMISMFHALYLTSLDGLTVLFRVRSVGNPIIVHFYLKIIALIYHVIGIILYLVNLQGLEK